MLVRGHNILQRSSYTKMVAGSLVYMGAVILKKASGVEDGRKRNKKKDFIGHSRGRCMQMWSTRMSFQELPQSTASRWHGKNNPHTSIIQYIVRTMANYESCLLKLFCPLREATIFLSIPLRDCIVHLYFLIHIQVSLLTEIVHDRRYFK